MNKTRSNQVFFDGMKAVSLFGDEGWDILSGQEHIKGIQELFTRVPWLRRGVNIRANGVSGMPFALVDANGEDYDTSSDWTNKCGFLPDPIRLLWLVESALTLSGAAYLLKGVNKSRYLKTLRYLLPSSITPILDAEKGLVSFTRRVGTKEYPFPIEQMVYFWPPDPFVEIGPAVSSPASAACAAAGVLLNIDNFSSQFFERGAIKATILGVPATTSKDERDRLKEWWNGVITGIKNAFSNGVFNADSIKPVVIGDGLEVLSGETDITDGKKQDIAAAMNIPAAIMFSDAANYATAQEDSMHFIQDCILPECNLISEVLNTQVFEPLGLRWEFRPETIDSFQEDEVRRSDALVKLTNTGIPLVMALQILGYDLTEGQWAELDDMEDAKEEQAQVMQDNMTQAPSQDNQPDPTQAQDAEDIPQDTPQPEQPAKGLTIEALHDLDIWQRKAIRAVKAGGSPAVAFVSEVIPASILVGLTVDLPKCQTIDEVKDLFGSVSLAQPAPVDAGLDLARELKRANDLLERAMA